MGLQHEGSDLGGKVKHTPGSGALRKGHKRTGSRDRGLTSSQTKLRKSKSGGVTAASRTKLKDRVHGNRHIAGCLNHYESNSRERSTGPKQRPSPFKRSVMKSSKSKRQMSPG
jgi:hypothetical protein